MRITLLGDNSTDVLLTDEGPVRRWGLTGSAGRPPILASAVTEDGKTVDSLRAEHGFSGSPHLPNGAFDLPTPSRSAIEGLGFTIIEDRRPSFLLDDRLLVTGEVESTSGLPGGAVVEQTVAALAETSPALLVPAHCPAGGRRSRWRTPSPASTRSAPSAPSSTSERA